MACATPLVATNVASIPEITGKYAILIPPKDSYAIADSIRKIFIDPNLYNIKAQEGRKHIQEKFNWTVIGKQYEELMRKVIKDHKTIIRGNNANL